LILMHSIKPSAFIFLNALWLIKCQNIPVTVDSLPKITDPSHIHLSGKVCTEDTLSSHFFHKIVLIIDASLQADASLYHTLKTAIQKSNIQRPTSFAFISLGDHALTLPIDKTFRFYESTETEEILPYIDYKHGSSYHLKEALELISFFLDEDVHKSIYSIRSRTFYSIITVRQNPVLSTDLESIQKIVEKISKNLKEKDVMNFSFNDIVIHASENNNVVPLTSISRSNNGDIFEFQRSSSVYYDFFSSNMKKSFLLSSFFVYNKNIVLKKINNLTHQNIPQHTCEDYSSTEDVDSDFLSECLENWIGTDMFNPDSDDDNVIDGIEILYGMDPTDDFDAFLDLDGDSVSSQMETLQDTSPYIFSQNHLLTSLNIDPIPDTHNTYHCYQIKAEGIQLIQTKDKINTIEIYMGQKNLFSQKNVFQKATFFVSFNCMEEGKPDSCSRNPGEEFYNVESVIFNPILP
jgi:hypothetical protein